jgi:hypothetical protein
MKYTELVNYTINGLNEESFENLKKSLLNKYIFFSIIDDDDVTDEILAEKICDYFEILFSKTNDNWDKFLKNYFKVIDSKVGTRISPITKTNPDPCRARQYYERAKSELKDNKDLTSSQLVDYYRIMFCLYNSILYNNGQTIENFDYSLNKMNVKEILLDFGNIIYNRQNKYFKKVKDFFDEGGLYTREKGMLVLSIIISNKFMDNRILGEYFNG